MGKQRRKFEVGFKQQIVNEVVSARSRPARPRANGLYLAERHRALVREIRPRRPDRPALGPREGGSSRENRDLKEKLAELYLQVQALKKWRTTHAGRKTPIPA